MFDLESFKIDLKALKADENRFQYRLGDEYFQALEAPDVQRGSLLCTVVVYRRVGFFELDFHIEGVVHIACNLCLDDMEQPISVENKLVAKLGESYSEEDDLVTVAEDEGILDVAWLIYEFIELAIPIRHVHAPGKCNPAMIEMLKQHSTARSGAEEAGRPVDPRWEALQKLKE